MTESTGGFIPKKEAVEIVETPIDKQQSRALGGLLESKLRTHLDATRTMLATLVDDKGISEDVKRMIKGCDKLDRVIKGLRNADQVGLDNHPHDQDFIYHYSNDAVENPPLPIGTTTIDGDDYKKIMYTLVHQTNTALTTLQYAMFLTDHPQAIEAIDKNRANMSAELSRIIRDQKGITITVHPDLSVAMTGIEPTGEVGPNRGWDLTDDSTPSHT